VCDAVDDCSEGEDERDCSFTGTCPFDMFTCNSGSCISFNMVCDGEIDCDDGSDETPGRCKPIQDRTVRINCSEGFICDDMCMPASVRCNDTAECLDESDEHDCLITCPDTKNHFQCKDQKGCVMSHWVCDGDSDCSDGSDEENCDGYTAEVLCHPHEYRCQNGECVSIEQVCDGYFQCSDGTDEHEEKCKVCDVDNGGCGEHVCHPTPQGASCSCRKGFKETWENFHLTCEDIDECSLADKCPQNCSNLKGSYECSCVDGFISEKGGSQCRALGEDMKLIFVSKYSIKMIDPLKNGHMNLVSFHNPVESIAIDQRNKIIFASVPTRGVIMRVQGEELLATGTTNLDDQKPFLVNTGRVSHMAYDWVTKNLYFSTKGSDIIQVCTELAICTNVFKAKNNFISGLAVDPLQGRLFVSSFKSLSLFGAIGVKGDVSTYSLSGQLLQKSKRRLSGKKLGVPIGLNVDIHKQRVYWIDKLNGYVYWSDYSGDKTQLLTALDAFQTSLHNFQNTLFWINPKINKVYSYNIMTHKAISPFVQHVPEHAHSLLVVQEQLQPESVNDCEDSPCSHICVASKQTDLNYTCLCPLGMKLSDDKDICINDVEYPSLVPVADSEFEDMDGPEKTAIQQDSTAGMVAGLIIFFLAILLFIGLVLFWCKSRKKKVGNDDVMQFTNSSYTQNNNESHISEKTSEGIVRRGALISCDNPMFVDSPQNTPSSGRFGFLKFGSEPPSAGPSPSMDFSSIVTVAKVPSTSASAVSRKDSIDSATMSYDDDFSVAFHKDKDRLILEEE